MYGETSLQFSGPRIAGATCNRTSASGTALVQISFAPIGVEGRGVVLRSGYGFQICSAAVDGGCWSDANVYKEWHSVNITHSDPTSVTFSAPNITLPSDLALRYGFDDMPSQFFGTQPAIYNAGGLPTTPWNGTVSCQ